MSEVNVESEMYLADLDPYEDRVVRLIVMNPNQVMIEPMKKIGDSSYESVGPQLLLSIDGLVGALHTLHHDDQAAAAERQGIRMGYQFTQVSGKPGKALKGNDDE